MANCSRGNGSVALVMTRGQAETLRAILRRVGGDPDTTRRGDCTQIDQALAGQRVAVADITTYLGQQVIYLMSPNPTDAEVATALVSEWGQQWLS